MDVLHWGGAPVRPGPVLCGLMPSRHSLAHRGPETGPGVVRCSDAGPGSMRGAGLLTASEGAFPQRDWLGRALGRAAGPRLWSGTAPCPRGEGSVSSECRDLPLSQHE